MFRLPPTIQPLPPPRLCHLLLGGTICRSPRPSFCHSLGESASSSAVRCFTWRNVANVAPFASTPLPLPFWLSFRSEAEEPASRAKRARSSGLAGGFSPLNSPPTQLGFSPGPSRCRIRQNKFMKNSPKSSCQPPTHPRNPQNARPHCRFLSRQLGILTPPNLLNLN